MASARRWPESKAGTHGGGQPRAGLPRPLETALGARVVHLEELQDPCVPKLQTGWKLRLRCLSRTNNFRATGLAGGAHQGSLRGRQASDCERDPDPALEMRMWSGHGESSTREPVSHTSHGFLHLETSRAHRILPKSVMVSTVKIKL